MSEMTQAQQVIEAVKDAWSANQGLSWELAGQITLVVLAAFLTMYVTKHAKNFKDRLKKDE